MSADMYLMSPLPTLVASGGTGVLGDIVLVSPLPTLAAGTIGTPGVIALEFPLPTLNASGIVGVAGDMFLTMPMPTLVSGHTGGIALTALSPVLAASGGVGSVGSAVLSAYAPSLVASGITQTVGSLSLSALSPTVSISGVTGATGGIAATLQGLSLAASGVTGTVGTASLVLPIFSLECSASHQAIGSIVLEFPALQLTASGVTATTGTSLAFAMHLETQALTQYTNYGLNSMACFNGVYLGATDAGIFALTGATDAGTAIAAVARVGMSDFGTSKIKGIDRTYVGIKSTGEMELRVITDEGTTRRYRLAPTTKTGLHGNSVDVGRGVKSRYWQFEIANSNGADFKLDMIEVKPTIMGRRIGGEEA